MAKEIRNIWFQSAQSALAFEPESAEKLADCLREDFKLRTGLEMPPDTLLLPPLPAPFDVQFFNSSAILDGDLVIRGNGIAVRACWKADAVSKQVSSPVLAWWDVLPKDEILEAMEILPIVLPEGKWPFHLDTQFHAWPDCELHIKGKDLDVTALESLLLYAQRTFNASHDGLIHSIGAVVMHQGGDLSVTIDFGTSEQDGLIAVLDTLASWGSDISSVTLTNPTQG